MENDQDCGLSISDSLMRSNLGGLSSKTSQDLSKTDSTSSCKGFPKRGMMLNGQLLKLPTLDSPIEGRGSTLLPTCVASDNMNVISKTDQYKLTRNGRLRRHTIKGKNASLNLSRFVRFFPQGPLTVSESPTPVDNPLCPNFVESLMGFPKDWTNVEEKPE